MVVGPNKHQVEAAGVHILLMWEYQRQQPLLKMYPSLSFKSDNDCSSVLVQFCMLWIRGTFSFCWKIYWSSYQSIRLVCNLGESSVDISVRLKRTTWLLFIENIVERSVALDLESRWDFSLMPLSYLHTATVHGHVRMPWFPVHPNKEEHEEWVC